MSAWTTFSRVQVHLSCTSEAIPATHRGHMSELWHLGACYRHHSPTTRTAVWILWLGRPRGEGSVASSGFGDFAGKVG